VPRSFHIGRTHVHIWDDFEETKHPRGGKGTAKGGQFVKKGQGGSGASEQNVSLEKTTNRAWQGRPSAKGADVPKHQLGALGESIAVQYLKNLGFKDAIALHVESSNNFPLDLVGDHQIFEVKTGIAHSTTPRWRITIGQPGKAETEWLKTAPPEEKRDWNRKKVEMAIARKHEVVAQMAKEVGRPLNPKTIGIILDPTTGIADIHVLDGFHADVGWNSPAVKSAYKGSFKYAAETGSRRLPQAA
jgi:hypothetical protein